MWIPLPSLQAVATPTLTVNEGSNSMYKKHIMLSNTHICSSSTTHTHTHTEHIFQIERTHHFFVLICPVPMNFTFILPLVHFGFGLPNKGVSNASKIGKKQSCRFQSKQRIIQLSSKESHERSLKTERLHTISSSDSKLVC